MTVSRAWWLYFWFLCAVNIGVLVAGPIDWATVLSLVCTAIVLAGLWGYLRQRPIAGEHVWRIVLGLLIASFVYAAVYPFFLSREIRAIGVAGVAVALLCSPPLLLALWRYAFRSRHLWAGRRAD